MHIRALSESDGEKLDQYDVGRIVPCGLQLKHCGEVARQTGGRRILVQGDVDLQEHLTYLA